MEDGLIEPPPQHASGSPQEDGPAPADGPADEDGPVHPARILISSTRKPVSYINLAKRFLQEHGEVAPMVTVAEILKGRRLAVEKRLTTSLESLSGEYRMRQKPKMEVLLTKSDVFDEAMASEAQRYSTYEDDVASDAESANGEVGDVEAEEGEAEAGGSVKEKEGLPDGPEASAALGVHGGDSDDE